MHTMDTANKGFFFKGIEARQYSFQARLSPSKARRSPFKGRERGVVSGSPIGLAISSPQGRPPPPPPPLHRIVVCRNA